MTSKEVCHYFLAKFLDKFNSTNLQFLLENEINGRVFNTLKESDFKELGIFKFGIRREFCLEQMPKVGSINGQTALKMMEVTI